MSLEVGGGGGMEASERSSRGLRCFDDFKLVMKRGREHKGGTREKGGAKKKSKTFEKNLICVACTSCQGEICPKGKRNQKNPK